MDNNKEYFLSGTQDELAGSVSALSTLIGYLFTKSKVMESIGIHDEDVRFYRSLYNPIKLLHDSIRPDFLKIRNLEMVVEESRKRMVNEIVDELTKSKPEELINNLNKILSKYEIIGRDKRPDGDDTTIIPF